MRRHEGYHRSQGPREPSAAQRRVLDALTSGRSNPEIAAELGLTVETVKWHIAQLLAETGCRDRAELARWWRTQTDRRRALAPILMLLAHAAKVALPGAVVFVVAATVVIHGDAGRRPPPVPQTAVLASQALSLVATGFSVPVRPDDPGVYAFVLDNTGGASGVAYVVRLLDAGGGIIDLDAGTIPHVEAGARLGWTGIYASDGPSPAAIAVQLQAVPPTKPGADVALVADQTEVRILPPRHPVYGRDAEGDVANRGTASVRDARVSAVAYDATGAVIGGGEAYVPLLRPGQSLAVKVRIFASGAPARVEFYPAPAPITTVEGQP